MCEAEGVEQVKNSRAEMQERRSGVGPHAGEGLIVHRRRDEGDLGF